MIARYRSGETMAELGRRHGVSRERVRQLLAEAGVTQVDSPLRVQGKARAAQTKEARRLLPGARLVASASKWGLTTDEYQALVEQYGNPADPPSPFANYQMQRHNAAARGIGWEFAFIDWWAVWQRSGKWELRGRGQGYCMARFGDVGPYRVGNVHIITGGENMSESYQSRPAADRQAKRVETYRARGLGPNGWDPAKKVAAGK